MSKKEEKQMDRNLNNYQIEGVDVPFSVEGLIDLISFLEVVEQKETRVEQEKIYTWYTEDNKTFGGQPTQEQIEKLGLRRLEDRDKMKAEGFKEIRSSIGFNANLMRSAIYGTIEQEIKNGTIKHKSESKMSVVEKE